MGEMNKDYYNGEMCYRLMSTCMTHLELIGFLRGCILKYIYRFTRKGHLEDLHKAKWYLDKLITEYGLYLESSYPEEVSHE